eukprot:475735-Amphidinium_carterae.1
MGGRDAQDKLSSCRFQHECNVREAVKQQVIYRLTLVSFSLVCMVVLHMDDDAIGGSSLHFSSWHIAPLRRQNRVRRIMHATTGMSHPREQDKLDLKRQGYLSLAAVSRWQSTRLCAWDKGAEIQFSAPATSNTECAGCAAQVKNGRTRHKRQ